MPALKHFPLLCLACLLAACPLLAQEAAEAPEEFPVYGWTGSFDGDYTLNFRIEENRARVYILDADNQPVDPELERINARIDPRGDDPYFIPLNYNADGKFFTHPRFVSKPYVFNVTLFIIGDDGESDRSYAFYFSQTGDNVAPEED